MPLDAVPDDGAGKPTSVIVEHRTPRGGGGGGGGHQQVPVTVDPYRCRGSITHGTAAGAVKPISSATPMLRHGGGGGGGGPVPGAAAPALPPPPLTATRDEAPWMTAKKPTCVVNGLCWTGSQTVPSAARPLSPPSKVDLISQGLVPNPLYSSAAAGGPGRAGGGGGGAADVLPGRLAVAGVDYAVDMSAKRTAAAPVTRCCPEVPPPMTKRVPPPRCDLEPSPSAQWPPSQSQQCAGVPPGASYMDSFKSFVDHAVQSAFMDDTEKELAAARCDGGGVDPARSAAMGLILRTLTSAGAAGGGSSPNPSRLLRADAPGPPPSSVSHSDLAVTGSEKPALSSPSQMPSLAASSSSPSPAAINHAGPPLLVPQCPLTDSSDDRSAAVVSPALSTAAGSDRAGPGRSDTDSETLSAHSPAPVLVPAAATPPPQPPVNAACSSLHLKKTWLLRYSDEDRKNATSSTSGGGSGGPADSSSRSTAAESSEKSTDCGAATDEKHAPPPTSSDAWTSKPKQNGNKNSNNGGEATSLAESDTKTPAKGSSEKQPKGDSAGKKGGQGKSTTGHCRETADLDGKATTTTAASDGKDAAIKNCFINCTYLSAAAAAADSKDQQDAASRSLRRVVKDSSSASSSSGQALDDKEAQSGTSKESDDSQVQYSLPPRGVFSLP